MSNTINIDFLIVGQGIAGTVLAHQLIDRNKSVHIIDNGHVSSSSHIAGGVTHPMSFKRIILSWKADMLIPFAKEFYRSFEAQFNNKVFYNLPMNRVFSSVEEQNNWQGRMADYPMNEIIGDTDIDLSGFELNAPFGTGKVNLAGRLDVRKFINLSKKHFEDRKIISSSNFDFSQLKIKENAISYGNINAKQIVFCEGYKFTENPYFNYIPLSPTKGEILIIKTNELPTQF